MKAAATKVVRQVKVQAVEAGEKLPDNIIARWEQASKAVNAELAKPPTQRGAVGALVTKLADIYPHVAGHISQAQGFGAEAVKMAVEIAEAAAKVHNFDLADKFYRIAITAIQVSNRGVSDAAVLVACFRGHSAVLLSLASEKKASKSVDPALFRDLNLEAGYILRTILQLQEGVHGANDRVVQGTLHGYGTAAEALEDYDLALECLRRNSAMKAAQNLPTIAVDKQAAQIEAKVKLLKFTDAQRNVRRMLFDIQFDEIHARRNIFTAALRLNTGAHRLERQQFLTQGWKSGPRMAKKDTTSGVFDEPANPVEAAALFRSLVSGAKAAVQAKSFADAESNYKRALALSRDPANADEISKSDQVVVLGSLGFVYCMIAQNDTQRQSAEYKATMAQAVPHYRAAISVMDTLKRAGAKVAPETLEGALMQLGIVACNIDKPDAGMHLLKRCRVLKQRHNGDLTTVDKHLAVVEKTLAKRDVELLQQAAKRLDLRAQSFAVDKESTVQTAINWTAKAKAALQDKNFKDAESAAIAAVFTFDLLAERNPNVTQMPEFRQALTTGGAVYYTLGQNNKTNLPAFQGFNQISLSLYSRAIALQRDAAKSATDPAIAAAEYNIA